MIPRDKMKNITYGYANEGKGLSTVLQLVWLKSLRHIIYAVAHAQCLRPKVETDGRKFKAMKESFYKTTDMYMAIRYQHKIPVCIIMLWIFNSHRNHDKEDFD